MWVTTRYSMHGLYVEHRTLFGNESLSGDIAHHMFTRQLRGLTVVACEHPSALLPAVSKQWRKVVWKIQRQRSSTLNAAQIYELTKRISHMQALRFSVKQPCENQLLSIDILFATTEDLLLQPPTCHTLYLTVPLIDELLAKLTSQMPERSLVVKY